MDQKFDIDLRAASPSERFEVIQQVLGEPTDRRRVEVQWEDSSMEHGWVDGKEISELDRACAWSVGWVVRLDSVHLTVAGHRVLSGLLGDRQEAYAGLMTIPMSAVRGIKILDVQSLQPFRSGGPVDGPGRVK